MMKPFSFLNPGEEGNEIKNWQHMKEQTTFLDFSDKITTTNLANVGTKLGWVAAVGPMCYYYIMIDSTGGGASITGASGTIDGVPYGPPSKSGLKSTVYKQWLNFVDTNGNEVGPNQRAYLTYNGSAPRINLLNNPNSPTIYVYGWVFRDA